MTTPAIEVVIAVHNADRPIRQAVESVLEAGANAGVLVVAHHVPVATIESRLSGLTDQGRVRVVGFSDGIPSPAGPFNYGLSVASAEFVSVLGSDDRLEQGALDAALARAREDEADVVIFPIRVPGVVRVRNPLARRGRMRDLDPVKDRVFGRTAPLGLIRREVVDRFAPVFDPAFATGEDLEFGARLWSTVSVSYRHLDPAYRIGVDATDRVTELDADLKRTLAAPVALARRSWVSALDGRVRRALAAKILRVSVIGGIVLRTDDAEPIGPEEVEILAETRRRWLTLSPGAERALPRADRRLLDECREASDDRRLRRAVIRRREAGFFARIMTRNPFLVCARDGVLRRYAIYARLRREERSLR